MWIFTFQRKLQLPFVNQTSLLVSASQEVEISRYSYVNQTCGVESCCQDLIFLSVPLRGDYMQFSVCCTLIMLYVLRSGCTWVKCSVCNSKTNLRNCSPLFLDQLLFVMYVLRQNPPSFSCFELSESLFAVLVIFQVMLQCPLASLIIIIYFCSRQTEYLRLMEQLIIIALQEYC